MQKKITLLLTASLILLLSACGWQLRHSQIVPTNLQHLHLASADAHSALITQLTRALNLYGVKVVASAVEADYSVVIVDFTSGRHTSTINPSARVAEYQLNEEVNFLIVDSSGKQLAPLSTASVERVYEFDEQDILASRTEEQSLRNKMREDIVRQILNHLHRLPDNAEPKGGVKGPAMQ